MKTDQILKLSLRDLKRKNISKIDLKNFFPKREEQKYIVQIRQMIEDVFSLYDYKFITEKHLEKELRDIFYTYLFQLEREKEYSLTDVEIEIAKEIFYKRIKQENFDLPEFKEIATSNR